MGERLTGRRVLVTGASRGIGAGIAERLAAEGATLTLVARTLDAHPTLPGSLNETAERCRTLGADVTLLVADLTDETRSELVADAAEAMGGHVEILINNAAAAIYQPLDEYPLKRRRLMVEMNVHAPLDLAQAALPAMAEAGEGWIINLSSGSAVSPGDPPYDLGGVRGTYGFYAASKAMLNRLTQAMAAEWHERGVRVNTVEPKAAVLSEGADVHVGTMLREDQIESMEAMCESVLWLCDCGPDHTGKIEVSLDLLEREGIAPMNLQATATHPGGFRR
ncbi:MAG: SDR family NAD(P)-dependent oxidoreductase [Actinomycetota bacterium]